MMPKFDVGDEVDYLGHVIKIDGYHEESDSYHVYYGDIPYLIIVRRVNVDTHGRKIGCDLNRLARHRANQAVQDGLKAAKEVSDE